MIRTPQQQSILDALINTPDHLAIIARAGCGKTTTILDAVTEVVAAHPRAEILVCAFNKPIATEVGEKLVKRGHTNWRQVQAQTLHALGFGLLKFLYRPEVDKDKVRTIVRGCNEPIYLQYGSQIEALVRYAKGAGVGFFNDLPIGDVKVWHNLADHYDVNGLDDTSESDAVVEAAQHVYRTSLNMTHVIDYDDMILFPLIKNLRVKFQKDFIFLDEAQDLSRARQALARKFIKYPSGRMIIVGDDRQAIYGFSGADAAAMGNMISDLKARTLPLSVTWRCPRAVVDLARTIVNDIEAAPTAKEGAVIHMDGLPDDLAPGDAILCRKTAPLISAAYRLIRQKIACKVEGRAIGDGLVVLAGRWSVTTIDALLIKLDTYKDREIQKAMAKGREQKAQEVEDRVETLKHICRICIERGQARVSDVQAFINDLFGDDVPKNNQVTLATYHRSKGREWRRVILLDHHVNWPSRAARQTWQIEQEDNLAYVAFTRAQETLIFSNTMGG